MSAVYSVGGMTCGGCASAVEKALKTVKADAVISVDLDAETVTVEGLEDAAAIENAIEEAGFDFNGAA
ncbi:MAG: heavy-metal-associated domain-containing protein [Rhodospirillaceae bacterium]